LNLFAERLAERWEGRDAVLGIKSLEELQRQEGETAWPEIAVFHRACEAAKLARLRAEENQRARVLVRWKCPDCALTFSGYVDRNDSLERRCKGMGRVKVKDENGKERIAIRKDLICGARLEVVYRDQDEILPPQVPGMVRVDNFAEQYDARWAAKGM
jgi:hypothetical protein